MPVSDPSFIGRRRELALLTRVFEQLPRSGSGVAVIRGEAGVGKTRLAREFVGRLPADAVVLHGACRMGGVTSPYEPFTDALRPIARGDGHSSDAARRLLSTLMDPARSVDVHAAQLPSQLRSFDAVLDLLADFESPAVLIIDDVQWADESSIDLLTFLVRNLRREAVMTLALYRDEPHVSAPVRQLLADIRRGPGAASVALTPFDTSDLQHLVSAVLGTAPTSDQLSQIAELTGGNPFFVEQILAGGERRTALPPAARDLLLDIVGALGPATKDLCALLAVSGGRLDRRLAEMALKPDGRERAIQEAVGAGVATHREDHYQLRHSLYRQVILDGLLPSAVCRFHADIAACADRLAKRGLVAMPAAQIARHWLAAGDKTRAVPALREAARLATRATALRDAHQLWGQLIDVLGAGPSEHRSTLLEALAEGAAAARWVGEISTATDLVARALRLTGSDDRLMRARLHQQLAQYRRLTDGPRAALWDSERAYSLLTPEDPAHVAASVSVEYAGLLMACGRMTDGFALANRALETARAADIPSLEGRAGGLLGIARLAAGHVEDAVTILQESRQLAAAYGDFGERISASNNLSFALLESDRLREGLAAATESIELARRVGVLELGGAAAVARCNAIVALVYAGRWAEADRLIDAVLTDDNDKLGLTNWLLGTQAQLRAATGRFEDAETIIAALDPATMTEPAEKSGYAAALAELAIWLHQPDRAYAAALDALSVDAPASARAYLLPWCLRAIADTAQVARLRGDATGSLAKAGEADRLLQTYGTDLEHAPSGVARALIVAERARATTGYVVAEWQELATAASERPYERAYALLRVAEALSDSHAHDDAAAAALSEARRLASTLGARPLLDLIDGLAARAALALAPDASTDATMAASAQPHLTPREREVLASLKLGLTNRKIARSLNITEKTAGVHVSNIMAKLGVANRTAAAAVAHYMNL